MKIDPIHPWNLGVKEAIALQKRLRKRLRRRPPLKLGDIATVAGADIAIDSRGTTAIGAVVVLTFPALEPVEARTVRARLAFPYVPGLLSFREIPVLLVALSKIKAEVDVLLCDGQGIAHPRGIGLASHLGLCIGIPTIGCAKSRLVGEHGPVGTERGSFAPLIYRGARVGSVVRTRTGVKPLFVSPGHMIDMASSRRIVLACAPRFRLPEPTRLAHIAAGAAKKTSTR